MALQVPCRRSMAAEEQVILVDADDQPQGLMSKEAAHRSGMLHRAFSVFVFNDTGEWLLQRRALGKYHSGGLWTNACCSHARLGESILVTADRRLSEEMGIRCPLQHRFSFLYRCEFANGLIEHEFDHVLFGRSSAEPLPDPNEVGAWKWLAPAMLRAELAAQRQQFTAWFRIAFERVMAEGGS
jgi:isopentenyl-diphosphate delta-isomerase